MPSVYEYACLSRNVYGPKRAAVDDENSKPPLNDPYPDELPKGWKLLGEKMNENGLAFRSYRGTAGPVVLAFRGTEANIKDLRADAQIAVGTPLQARSGLQAYRNLRRTIHSRIGISVTGHSLGGFIAAYVALMEGVQAVAFNAPGFSGRDVAAWSHNSNIRRIYRFRAIGEVVSVFGNPLGYVHDIKVIENTWLEEFIKFTKTSISPAVGMMEMLDEKVKLHGITEMMRALRSISTTCTPEEWGSKVGKGTLHGNPRPGYSGR